MKILLLQPQMNWRRPYCETPSIALLTLAAMAEGVGHSVRVKHLDIDNLELDELNVDLIGITCNTFQVKSARELVKQIRLNRLATGKPDKIVLGGPHAVAWNNDRDGKVDQIVVGEGEKAWSEIVGCEAPATIDDIPLPDYSLVRMNRFCGVQPLGAVPSMVIFGARGCPGKCIFCNTPVFWGSHARYRKPESIVSEIEFFNKQFGAREVFFQDDTFNANKSWAIEIFDRIMSKGLNKTMVFRIDCRTNKALMTEDFVIKAKQAGVWSMFLGIESGSQMMLDSMKKHVTVAENERAIELLHYYGIQVQAAFIVGLPGETRETIQASQDFIYRTKPEVIGYGFATPFPATELDRIVTAKGHKRDVDYADYRYGQLYVRTDALTFEQLESFKGFLPARR